MRNSLNFEGINSITMLKKIHRNEYYLTLSNYIRREEAPWK